MSNRATERARRLGKWLWILPALAIGLYVSRLFSELLRPGLAGALLLTLFTLAISLIALSRSAFRQSWPLLLLLFYVFYPEPDPRLAVSAGFAALFGLLFTTNLPRLPLHLSKRAVDAIWLSLLGISFLVLYVNTLAPGLLPADGGELQLVAAKWGVAHPTGFPLYTMLANIATRLPLGPDAAYRTNLLSAVTSTAAVLLVYLAVYRLSGNRLAGLLAGMVLGTSTTFWSQATTANVRSLTALFTAGAFYLLLILRDGQTKSIELAEPGRSGDQSPDQSSGTQDRRELGLLALFVLVLVLAITHHTSLLFIGGLFGLYALVLRPDVLNRPGRWPVLLLAGLIGLLPLLYLPLRGAAGAIGAPDDLATVGGFLNHVLGLGFRGDLLFFDQLSVLGGRLLVMINVLTFQFSAFVLLIMSLGLLLLFGHDRLLAVVIGAAFFSHTLVAAVYRAPQTVEYMLPAYVLLAILYGYAAGYLRGLAKPPVNGRQPAQARSALAVLLLVAMIMAVVSQLAGNYESFRWLSRDRTAREYAQPLLLDAPGGSLLLADWHWVTPLWYLQEVEGQRPDVDVQFVFPEAGPYAETWAGRIAAELAAGRTVISTHFEPGAYARLPLAEPFHEAFLFRQQPLSELPQDYTPLDVELGPGLTAAGYLLDSSSVQPGRELVTQLAWRSDGQPEEGRTFFAHLIGPDGQLVAGDDQTAQAQDSGLTINQFRLTPQFGTSPGVYDLVVGSYDAADPAARQATTLAQVTVEESSLPPFTLNRRFRPLADAPDGRTLIGADWDSTFPGRQRLYLHWWTESGYETQSVDVDGGRFAMPDWFGPWGIKKTLGALELDEPANYVPFGQGLIWLGQATADLDSVQPGERVALPQRFTTSRPILRDLVVSLRLVGYQEDGQSWHWWDLDDGVPAMGAIPTLKWIAGSQVRDPIVSRVSDDAWDGQQVEPLLTLYDAFTSRRIPILDERFAQQAPWIPLGRTAVEAD